MVPRSRQGSCTHVPVTHVQVIHLQVTHLQVIIYVVCETKTGMLGREMLEYWEGGYKINSFTSWKQINFIQVLLESLLAIIEIQVWMGCECDSLNGLL